MEMTNQTLCLNDFSETENERARRAEGASRRHKVLINNKSLLGDPRTATPPEGPSSDGTRATDPRPILSCRLFGWER